MASNSNHNSNTTHLDYGPWKFSSTKGHILTSDQVERYTAELKLPQLPEMTFGENTIKIVHASGFDIHFSALDALNLVDKNKDVLKVAASGEWKESRIGHEFIDKVIKPFDWTYTTKYKGTIRDPVDAVTVESTDESINIERLKVREKILFFDDLMLFEDELADNGCSQLNVKIRVMPSCFFVLMRLFLRVDGVLYRMLDTRLFHEFDKDYMIREFMEKENSFDELQNIPPSSMSDVAFLSQRLETKLIAKEKIRFKDNKGET